ncbi:hypothetical protein Nepgr_033942 [Nepenthes gracilis]|uniref:Uncharacterized protein n=1 Tax=Nepenthes gracilis TaxID=150966 RepID=A0AAD3Y7B5_NEPGR|nr:hypothetical protein Nepgr_033942 [Nepenthes gracilis]
MVHYGRINKHRNNGAPNHPQHLRRQSTKPMIIRLWPSTPGQGNVQHECENKGKGEAPPIPANILVRISININRQTLNPKKVDTNMIKTGRGRGQTPLLPLRIKPQIYRVACRCSWLELKLVRNVRVSKVGCPGVWPHRNQTGDRPMPPMSRVGDGTLV